MSIALVGGIDRLERHYISEAEKFGISLKVFTKSESEITSKIKHMDAVVIFTNKVSHRAKNEAMAVANNNNIPVLMRHSCGICSLRDCFNCLKDNSSSFQRRL
jgi:hypothetical protein